MTPGWEAPLAAVLLALALSLLVAWSYRVTYEGLGYRREFAQTLALGGVVAAMVLLAIGDEIARGVGLVGALTLIRFRSTLKDTRDLIFAFASLGAGVACGAGAFAIAVLGTATFLAAGFYVSWSSFGVRQPFDAVLRLQLPAATDGQQPFLAVLRRHCRGFALVQLREAGPEAEEHVYQLRLGTDEGRHRLVQELGRLPGAAGISLLMHEPRLEA